MDLPVSFEEYITSFDDGKYEINPERIKRRSIYHRMLDIWGEVNRARAAWLKWHDEGLPEDLASLERQMNLVDRLCYMVYCDENATFGMKRSLRVAEWELYDFFFMENRFRNTADTVTRWFDQWNYHHVRTALVT